MERASRICVVTQCAPDLRADGGRAMVRVCRGEPGGDVGLDAPQVRHHDFFPIASKRFWVQASALAGSVG